MPLRFGDFVLDESRRQLLRAGEPVRLSPKAFQLLSTLALARPRAMSKVELQEKLWPDTYVTEGNLANLVAELRSALGDDRARSQFIRTLYGFGYAFTATVEEEGFDDKVVPPHPAAAAVRRRPLRRVLPALLASGFAVLLVSAPSSRETTRPVHQPIRSIAVLPFDTSALTADEKHLGLGLADVVITRLTNVRQLAVRPTSAIRPFAGRAIDSAATGRKLGVDAVVEGSVRTSGENVRLTVELLDVRDGKPLWAERFDARRSSMFVLEDDLSARVASALMLHITPGERKRLTKRSTGNAEAYQLYLMARYSLQNGGSGGTVGEEKRAAELFERAVEKDPDFALAWAGLGQAYAVMPAQARMQPALAWPRAERAALRTLQLDPENAEAHGVLGFRDMYWKLDFVAAEREFKRALALNPRAQCLTAYAVLLQALGRLNEAIEMRKRALAADPLNPNTHWGLANAFLTAGHHDVAAKLIAQLLVMEPNHYEAKIARIRLALARNQYEQAVDLGQALVASDDRSRGVAFLGYAMAKSGRTSEARELLRSLEERSRKEYIPPFPFVVVHLGLGEYDEVFTLLEKGLENREYTVRLAVEPLLDPIRSDPRFEQLMERAGFRK